MKKTKRFKLRYLLLGLLGVLALLALVFMHFGGFGTGESADLQEFASHAQPVGEITIPADAAIIALGEATHGNVEFQQLKLTVFRRMVEQYGVRAFALEGDCGGCEQANRYIQGGAGTAQQAAAAIGFAIYRTNEMAELLAYMRQYNDQAPAADKLRFYGFDMQRYLYSVQFLAQSCADLGVDASALQALVADGAWNSDYDLSARAAVITQLKQELENRPDAAQAVHYAEMLLQYCALQTAAGEDATALRDKFMAQNAQWILQQEQQRGFARIFVSGHNGHVAKWGSMDSMGKLLATAQGGGYYAIGTDFYKTRCNLPTRTASKRTEQVFYSHDPLAKAAKMAGFDLCWLNFAALEPESPLAQLAAGYTYMGNLGEGYSLLMRLLPPSYRIFQPPATLYDSMIFVAQAHPTKILEEK